MKILINSVTGGPMPPSGYGGIERGDTTLVKGLRAIGEDPYLACTEGSTIDCQKLTFDPTTPGEHILEACKREWGEFDVIHDGTCNGSIYYPFKESESVFWTVPGIGGDGDLCCYLSKRSMELSPHPNGPLPYTLLGVVPSEFPVSYQKEDYILFIGSARPDRKYLHFFVQVAREYRLKAIALITSRISDPNYTRDCYCGWPFAVLDDVYDERLKLEYIGKAKALIHCSAITEDWQDASPLAVLEALACGTPVIGNYSGGIPEMIVDGKTGFLVDTVDQAIEAYGKLKLLGDDAEIARNCREYIEKERSHEMYARRCMVLYNKIAGRTYTERQKQMLLAQEDIDGVS